MVQYNAVIAALEAKDASGGVSDIAPFRARMEKMEKKLQETFVVVEAADEVQYVGINYPGIY